MHWYLVNKPGCSPVRWWANCVYRRKAILIIEQNDVLHPIERKQKLKLHAHSSCKCVIDKCTWRWTLRVVITVIRWPLVIIAATITKETSAACDEWYHINKKVYNSSLPVCWGNQISSPCTTFPRRDDITTFIIAALLARPKVPTRKACYSKNK